MKSFDKFILTVDGLMEREAESVKTGGGASSSPRSTPWLSPPLKKIMFLVLFSILSGHVYQICVKFKTKSCVGYFEL